MSDDINKNGGQDRKRISLSEDYEIQDWSAKFGVSKDELRAAVGAVGNMADDVQAYLKAK